MGYWSTDREGHSFATDAKDEDLIWGDQPADILDNALKQIAWVFLHDVGRLPTKAEILAGIAFSTGPNGENLALPETVQESAQAGPNEEQYEAITRLYYAATGGDVSTPQAQIEAARELVAALAPVLAPFEERRTAAFEADQAAFQAEHADVIKAAEAEVAQAAEEAQQVALRNGDGNDVATEEQDVEAIRATSKMLTKHLQEEHGADVDKFTPYEERLDLHDRLHHGDKALLTQTIALVDADGRRQSPILVTREHLDGHAKASE